VTDDLGLKTKAEEEDRSYTRVVHQSDINNPYGHWVLVDAMLLHRSVTQHVVDEAISEIVSDGVEVQSREARKAIDPNEHGQEHQEILVVPQQHTIRLCVSGGQGSVDAIQENTSLQDYLPERA